MCTHAADTIPYNDEKKSQTDRVKWLAGLLAEGDLAHSVLGSFDLV